MKFAIIGMGYISARHLRAIKELGHELVAALDPHDSVGILDSYFPECRFFTEFERFDRFIDKIGGVDYVSICSPNYLHDAHIRWSLRMGATPICEKPVVLNPWNIEALKRLEEKYQKKTNVILQLRLHPVIRALPTEEGMHRIKIRYCTPRGRWYESTWKEDKQKSGGLATNIGIHLFDMLLHTYGPITSWLKETNTRSTISGKLLLEHAKVEWFLSIDPKEGRERSMLVDGEPINFTDGFENLHTESYREILAGRGFGLSDALPSIELVHKLRG